MHNTEVRSNKAIELLLKKYEESKEKNARWSQRAFAARIGISSGALSEILSGKRALSSQLKKKIAPHLQMSPAEESDFFGDEWTDHLKNQHLQYFQLTNDQFPRIQATSLSAPQQTRKYYLFRMGSITARSGMGHTMSLRKSVESFFLS